jgi:transposase
VAVLEALLWVFHNNRSGLCFPSYVRLVGSYGASRVEAAAERAIEIGARTYGSVKSILDTRLDRRPAPRRPADAAPILHPNIRGPRYYH